MQLRDGWNIDYTMGEKNLFFFFSLKANKVKLTQLVRWTAVLSLSKQLKVADSTPKLIPSERKTYSLQTVAAKISSL